MKKSVVSLMLALIMCMSLIPQALAVEIGDTTISDEKGTTYILSKQIVGTASLTFWDDLETTTTHTVNVYLVPKDTIITLPEGNSSYLARWYTPDEYSRGGWGVFAESGLLPAGTELPFDLQTISPDGVESTTAAKENSTLRIYALDTFRSVYIRGVDAESTESTQTTAGLDNFRKSANYPEFSDVQNNVWYANNVKEACELGLMKGKGSGKFDPNGSLTLAEAVTIAARINSIYQGSHFSPGGDPWYGNAVAYSKTHGIISDGEFSDFTQLANRFDFANILYKSIPSQEFSPINQVDLIPDVTPGTSASENIYALYRAGVLTGDSDGSFSPNTSISRAEAAAIINRVVLPKNRIEKSLPDDREMISAATGTFSIKVRKGIDWAIKEDEVNKENGTYRFAYQSKTGRAVIRVLDFPKSVIPNASVNKVATVGRDDCVKHGCVISEKGIYDSSIAGFTGVEFEYKLDNGNSWSGRFTFFETDSHIYSVQQEINDKCSQEDRDVLKEIVESLTFTQ